jgi:hypothetical protein
MEAMDATNNSNNNLINNVKRKGKGSRSSGASPSQQCNTNWSQEEVLALICNKQKNTST